MNEIMRFEITERSYIYFHTEEELKNLFQFTEIKIGLHNEGKEDIILYHHDNLGEALISFYNLSKRVLSGNERIISEFENKSIGFWWNEYLNESLNKELEDKMISPLWSAVKNPEEGVKENATFIYRFANDILLEVCESYPWHFLDPEPNDIFFSYELYIQDYRSELLLKLSEGILKKWHTKTKELIKRIDLYVG